MTTRSIFVCNIRTETSGYSFIYSLQKCSTHQTYPSRMSAVFEEIHFPLKGVLAYKLRDLADSLDGVVARGAGGRLVPTPGSMVLNFFQILPSLRHYTKQTKKDFVDSKKCQKHTHVTR